VAGEAAPEMQNALLRQSQRCTESLQLTLSAAVRARNYRRVARPFTDGDDRILRELARQSAEESDSRRGGCSVYKHFSAPVSLL